jgi:hypothetical protein
MSRKGFTARRKGQQRKRGGGEFKHLYSVVSGLGKLPRASNEGCVLVPFALTACIPENAIRKFAAKKSFVVHVNGDCGELTVFYPGDH